jgi:hypothetical protein
VGGKLLAAALPHFILRYKRNVHIGRERDTTRGEISRPPPSSFPVCVGTRTQARVIRNVQEEKGPFFMIYLPYPLLDRTIFFLLLLLLWPALAFADQFDDLFTLLPAYKNI